MDILTLAIAKSKSGSPNGTITTENITNALGYKPADQEEVSKLSEDIADLKEKKVDKTTEEETLNLVTEMGLVEPVLSEDDLLYTDKDGMLFSL